jgi:flagellar basal-body rod protein FlgF
MSIQPLLGSRQFTHSHEIENLASELANAVIPGHKGRYKSINTHEMSFGGAATGPMNGLAYPALGASWTDASQGPLEKTGNAFHVALNGKDFLSVADGTVTRDGHLFLNPDDNTLRTFDQVPFLDTSGEPIQLPEETHNIRIERDGRIFDQNNSLIGEFKIMTVNDLNTLEDTGKNRYTPKEPNTLTPSENPTVLQGHLEGSNVSITQTLAKMTQIKTDAQMTGDLVRKYYERSSRLVNQLLHVTA